MDAATNADGRFHGYRFPAILIGEVVWLRFRIAAGRCALWEPGRFQSY